MPTPPKAKILSIRGVSEQVARDFAGSAAIRGYSQAEFLKQLMELHKFIRKLGWDLVVFDAEGNNLGGEVDGDTVPGSVIRWAVTGADAVEVVDDIGGYLASTHMWEHSA